MIENISRSELKRRAKRVEDLVRELVDLSGGEIKGLPCDDFLRQEIGEVRQLSGGSRKRQVKYIAKTLRQESETAEELLNYLAERKGSHLKEVNEFHELERLREALVEEAIELVDELRQTGVRASTADWPKSAAVAEIVRAFPGLGEVSLKRSALEFARSRNTVHKREIFRQLKAGLERRQLAARRGESHGV